MNDTLFHMESEVFVERIKANDITWWAARQWLEANLRSYAPVVQRMGNGQDRKHGVIRFSASPAEWSKLSAEFLAAFGR